MTDPDVPAEALESTEAETETDDDSSGVSQTELDALGDLAALQGVVKFPVRIKCATLSWNTLAQGLSEAESSAVS